MKLMASGLIVLALMTTNSGLLTAQSDPFVGTWMLNLSKSKYNNPAQAPKSQTRFAEPIENGVKVRNEGVAPDGSAIANGWTLTYDGTDSPITGPGMGNGADTIATKRINSHTTVATLKRAGKVVTTARSVVSKDGKVMTITLEGTDINGKQRNIVNVFDKQ